MLSVTISFFLTMLSNNPRTKETMTEFILRREQVIGFDAM
jgi:hypothetical protein